MTDSDLSALELTPQELSALENVVRDRESWKRRDGTWRFSYEETDLIESAIRKLKMRARLRHAAVLNLDIK
jgi:hypothetical protein